MFRPFLKTCGGIPSSSIVSKTLLEGSLLASVDDATQTSTNKSREISPSANVSYILSRKQQMVGSCSLGLGMGQKKDTNQIKYCSFWYCSFSPEAIGPWVQRNSLQSRQLLAHPILFALISHRFHSFRFFVVDYKGRGDRYRYYHHHYQYRCYVGFITTLLL
jgi:hypothetical protein